MTRPLLPILFCFISGILLEHHWGIVTQIDGRHFGSGAHLAQIDGRHFGSGVHLAQHLTLVGLYFVLFCIWYILYRFKYSRLSTFFLLIIAIVMGMTRYAATNQVPVHHISHFVKDERVTIEGFLYKPPELGVSKFGKRQYLYVETTWLEQEEFRYRVCGKVRITLIDPSSPCPETKTFLYGDTIRTRLRLHIPGNDNDTGDFDYREHLRRQGIYLVGNLLHDRYIIKLSERRGNILLAWIYSLRNRIVHFLDTYSSIHEQAATEHPSELIQVIKAMTLGTSRELSPEVKEKFRDSGMYHFLVVSGIHIGILVWVFHQVLHIVHVPLRYRSIFLTVVLLLYAGLTGFQFPVLRAVIMVLALYLSITCSRVSDPLYSLAFSGSIILFVFPAALFEISFQLTVAATASILMLLRFLKCFAFWERFSQFPYFIRLPLMTVIMAAGAMIGISPLMLYYFQRIYPYSLVLSLLAFPVISLLLPLSLFLEVLSLFFPWNIVYPLLSVDVILARGFMFLTTLFPVFDVSIPRPPLFTLVIYYIAVYCGFSFYRLSSRRSPNRAE